MPTPEPDQPRKVDELRRSVMCKSYDSCLDIAISSNWEGFHCMNCLDYKEDVPTYTEASNSYGKDPKESEWYL